jgi:hypothetical protein
MNKEPSVPSPPPTFNNGNEKEDDEEEEEEEWEKLLDSNESPLSNELIEEVIL